MNNQISIRVHVGLLIAAYLLCHSAIAQQVLEEITVTARKRAEDLQDTPIAVTAFGEQALEVRGITRLDGVAAFTPNLVFENAPTFSGSTSNAVVYIRGVGQNEFAPTTDQGVGIYVDGVYLGRSVGSVLELIDIERVEILRGPQGTLFGRNSIGGAISITTRKPAEEFGGKVDVKLGTDSLFNVKGSLDVPLGERLFSNLTVAGFQQDGYVLRPSDGADLGDNDTLAARAALRWLPSDEVEIDFSAEYSRDEDSGSPLIITDINQFGPAPPLLPSQTAINNAIQSIIAGASPPPGTPIYCITPPGLADPGCYNAQYIPDDRSTNFGTSPMFSDTDVWALTLSATWNVGNLEFRSITGYRNLEAEFAIDGDGSPLDVTAALDLYEQDQFTQELQLLGMGMDHRLNWILGLYYFEEDGFDINPVDFAAVNVRSGGFFDSQSWAIFAQATLDVTDRLSLTGGLRYTEDEKNYLPDQIILAVNPALAGLLPPPGTRVVPFEQVTNKTDEITPLVTLSYRLADELLTYFTYSEGFKGGGFTQRIFPPEPSIPAFEPEEVTSYEIGAKWTGLDNRLRINSAAFFTDYENLQLLVADPTRLGPFTTNAGEAEIKGFELELAALPGAGWVINGSLGWTDPEYTALSGGVVGLTTDSDFEHISEWNASASMEKSFGLGSRGRLIPRVNWSFRSEYGTNNTNINTPQFGLIEANLSLVNLSLRWESSGENLRLTAGVDNVTDEEYRLHGDYQDGFGYVAQSFHRGREWYLRGVYEF